MSAGVLEPASYAGVDISESSDVLWATFPETGDALLPPQYDQRIARVSGGWPRPLDPQPLERTITLRVFIRPPHTAAEISDFKRIFSARRGEQTLVASDGITDWEMQASVLRMSHTDGQLNEWYVTLQATEGVWKKTTNTIEPVTISAATTADIDATTIGNEITPAVVAVTPSQVKGQANDQRYRSQVTLAWRAARGAARYPIALTLDTATEVTAGRMLGTGDDLRVLVDGAEVPRWLGDMNTGATKVWIVQDFSPARTGALKAAITAGAPATGGNLELEDASDLPSTGLAMWGEEAIHWLMKSSDGRTLHGITRAARGTVAASHAAGGVGYLVTRQVDLIWGYSGATAPSYDPDTKPMFHLEDSSNGQWTYNNTSGFATAGGKRPAEWYAALLDPAGNPNLVALRGGYAAAADQFVPTGDGALNSFGSIVGAASRWQAVDDPINAPDDDSSYVELTNASHVFSVATSAEVPRGSLVRPRVYARAKANGTGASYKVLLAIGGTFSSVASAIFTAPNGSYGNADDEWDTSLMTGAQWAPDEFEGLEIGVDVNAFAGTATYIRFTQIYLEVEGVLAEDPATMLGVFYSPGGPQPGLPNRDCWMLDVPCTIVGYGSVNITRSGGGSNNTDVMNLKVRSTDGAVYTLNSGGTANPPATAQHAFTPQGPASQVIFQHDQHVTPLLFDGVALVAATLTFDPDATPLIAYGSREDTYVARFTLENETTEQTIEVLYPMAIGTTLTIDADAGTVTYSLPSYNPLPALRLDAPRIPWLELEAGENDLAWSDPTNGSAELALSLRWRDRRS